MWLRFTADFDFSPAARRGMYTRAYKAGMVENVTHECAELALEAGKAVREETPRPRGRRGKSADAEQQ